MGLREKLLDELFYPSEEYAEPVTTEALAFVVEADVEAVRRTLNFMLADGLVVYHDGWYRKDRS